MSECFVRVSCKICCIEHDAWYRLYINDEMFVERNAPDGNRKCVQEIMTLRAVPGRYLLWCRADNRTKLIPQQITILEGQATVESDQYIVIE